MPPPARCARSAAPGAAASKCECGGAEGRARSAGLARPDAESAAGAANACSAAASQSMPKGRAAYSSRAAGSLPARRQWKRGRLAGVLGHARRRPRYGRRRIANKECGARDGRKKSRLKGQAPNHLPLPPPPLPAQRARCGGVQRAPGCRAGATGTAGPCKRAAARSAAKPPASPPSEGFKDARTKGVAVRRPGLVGMRARRNLAAQGGRPAILGRPWGGARRKRSLAPRRAQLSFAPRAPRCRSRPGRKPGAQLVF